MPKIKKTTTKSNNVLKFSFTETLRTLCLVSNSVIVKRLPEEMQSGFTPDSNP